VPIRRATAPATSSGLCVRSNSFSEHSSCAWRDDQSWAGAQTAVLPPDLTLRPVVAPEVYWTWSLVRRADEERQAVLAVVDALCAGVRDLWPQGPDAWLPAGDPYRPEHDQGR
jgi:hypothetical protein